MIKRREFLTAMAQRDVRALSEKGIIFYKYIYINFIKIFHDF